MQSKSGRIRIRKYSVFEHFSRSAHIWLNEYVWLYHATLYHEHNGGKWGHNDKKQLLADRNVNKQNVDIKQFHLNLNNI